MQLQKSAFMRRRKTDSNMLQSGGEYEGFFKDLLDKLATDLQFDYFIEEEILHGSPSPDGNWTGLIGSLVKRVSKVKKWNLNGPKNM